MTKLRIDQLNLNPEGELNIATEITDTINVGNDEAAVEIVGSAISLTGMFIINGVEYTPPASSYTFDNGLSVTGSSVNIDLADTGIFTSAGAASRVPILTAASRLTASGVDRAGTILLGTSSATSITIGHDNIPIELTGSVSINGTPLVAYSDEEAQDVIGNILTDSSTIDFTYNDAVPSITAVIIDNSVSNSKLANVSASTFKGRISSGSGSPEDLTLTQTRSILYHWSEGLLEVDGYVGINVGDTDVFTSSGTALRVPILGVNSEIIASGVDGYYAMGIGTDEATSITIGHDSIPLNLIGEVTINGESIESSLPNPYESENQIWNDTGNTGWTLNSTNGIYLTSTSDIILNASGTISASNNRVRNVSTPVSSNDAATKSYVDDLVEDITEHTVTLDMTSATATDWNDLLNNVTVSNNESAYFEGVFIIRRRDSQDDETGTPYNAVRTYTGAMRLDATRGTSDVVTYLVPANIDDEEILKVAAATIAGGAIDNGSMEVDDTFAFQLVAVTGGFKIQAMCTRASALDGNAPFGLRYISPETSAFAITIPVDATIKVVLTRKASVTSSAELPENGELILVD